MKNRTITFIYSDNVEKMMMKMIGEVAQKHGYKTEFSNNKFKKCDIGFYCQHTNYPENSNFSIIMLHDITQQYSYWPNIWSREPWNKYDIGFLPSEQWKNNWDLSSQFFYSNPRFGVYLVGWPKLDNAKKKKTIEYKYKLMDKYGLDKNKKTVLYAPAWENDCKQNDFVEATKNLNVNILIKHAPWDEKKWPSQIKEIKKMCDIHKSMDGVYILDPKTNIMDAISMCDVLVSEESSTMGEAVMFGKPAISVIDWLIPDVKPSRFPSTNYDFVEKCKKSDLSNCIQNILTNYIEYKNKAESLSKFIFGEFDNTCQNMIDILDYVLQNERPAPQRLQAQREVALSQTEIKLFNKNQRHRLFYGKYIARFRLLDWAFMKYQSLTKKKSR